MEVLDKKEIADLNREVFNGVMKSYFSVDTAFDALYDLPVAARSDALENCVNFANWARGLEKSAYVKTKSLLGCILAGGHKGDANAIVEKIAEAQEGLVKLADMKGGFIPGNGVLSTVNQIAKGIMRTAPTLREEIAVLKKSIVG